MLWVLTLLVLETSTSTFAGQSFLQFVKIPRNIKVQKYHKSVLVWPPHWYAAFPTNFIIALYKNNLFQYVMNCKVETLNDNDAITEVEFCFLPLGSSDKNCKTLKPEDEVGQLKLNGKVTVELRMNKFEGGEASFSASTSESVSSVFYCTVTNRRGTLTSNNIIFRDYRTALKQTVENSKETPILYRNSQSSVNCIKLSGPDLNELFWEWQLRDRYTVAREKITLRPSQDQPLQVTKTGDLLFPYLNEDFIAKLKKLSYFDCQIFETDSKIYQKAPQIADSVTTFKELEVMYPLKMEEVTILNASVTNTYFCNFKMGRGRFQFIWKKEFENGSSIVLSDNNANMFNVYLGNYNSLVFEGPFTSNTEGKYICEMKLTNTDNRTFTKSSGYLVKLTDFPTISSLKRNMYIKSGDNATVVCKFKGKDVLPSIAINGKELQLQTRGALQSSIDSINKEFSSTMNPLEVDITPLKPKVGDVIYYKAIDMRWTRDESSSHQVTCIGRMTSSTGAVTRKSALLKVFPTPMLTESLEHPRCTECSTKLTYKFRCPILQNEDLFSSVVVHRYWKINDKPISSSEFVRISENNKSLTFKPNVGKQFISKINEGKIIRCVIKLEYPGDLNAFSSKNDKAMNTKLSAKFTYEVPAGSYETPNRRPNTPGGGASSFAVSTKDKILGILTIFGLFWFHWQGQFSTRLE